MLRALLFFLLAIALPLNAAGQACSGDCNGNGRVHIEELVQLGQCAAANDGGAIDAVIDNALRGCPQDDPLVVSTEEGLLRGNQVDGVHSFLGIPYAAAPLATRRWRRPQPHPGWSGIRNARAAGSSCTQRVPLINIESGSEDCLFLNVFTPAAARGKRLPVMVWLHGGAFTSGDALSFGTTDGSEIARRAGVIVVGMNYRLGQLGFLAHPQLAQEEGATGGGQSGNYGIADQIAALQWVQRNIGAFGGDPGNVTLFGESAGGWSICTHLIAPASAGLFQRAIIQSGICTLPFPTLREGEAQGERFAARLGCVDGDVAACLRSKTLTQVRNALPPDPNFAFSEGEHGYWSPVVDGDIAPAQISTLVENGRFNRVPILIGSNRDEGSLFVALVQDFVGVPLSAENYPRRISQFVSRTADIETVQQRYPLGSYATPGAALAEAFGDAFLACPTITAARLLARYVPVYAYQFDYPDAPFMLPVPVPLGAFHSAEIQYVFGRRSGEPFTPAETQLSTAMMGYWTSFATAGNPSLSTLPSWPAYAGDANFIRLDQQITGGQAPKAAACAFWDGLDYQQSGIVTPANQGSAAMQPRTRRRTTTRVEE